MIPGQRRKRVPSADGGNLDDMAEALFAQKRQARPGDMDDAPKIDIDLSLELVGSHFLKSSHEAIAGVIHHDINAAESLFGSGNSFFSLRRRFDVELNSSQLLAIPFAEIGQL